MGIDILGPLPLSKGQCKFVVVAVDYFTKWAEAEPSAKITYVKVKDFIWKNLVCCLGIPHAIVSDNAKQFDNKLHYSFYSDLQIKQPDSRPAHPQENGQAEVMVRTVLRNLKTRLKRAKGLWVDELPGVLWAYKTTPRAPTGETPFSLAFGAEAVILVEIGVHSLMVQNHDPITNENELRINLDLVEEAREMVVVRKAEHKFRMAKFYNSRVKHHSFQPGDLVLKKVILATKDSCEGKHEPNLEEPYLVTEVVRPGT